MREASDGHDGTWVAHPGLVAVAMEVFDEHMPGANQLDRLREDVHVTAADLLAVPDGPITEAGLRTNISVGVRYLESWLRGNGCVPIFNLMEDAATAEISRAQIWQWIRHPAGVLDDGRKITAELFRSDAWTRSSPRSGRTSARRPTTRASSTRAGQMFDQVTTQPDIRRVPDPARLRALALSVDPKRRHVDSA